MWLVTVAARSSWLPTRTMAARSQSPATEYTSLMPSRSARVSAVSEVRSTSQVISTIAVTMCAPDGRQAPPASPALQLVDDRADDARAAHADRVADGDGAPVDVGALPVELQLPVAGEHLRGERLVDLDHVDF